MEHRELSGKKVATYMESKRLAMNIAFYYGKQSNRQYATDGEHSNLLNFEYEDSDN